MKAEHYEKLTVTLFRESTVSRKELHTWLKRRGYKSEDDFYYLVRKGRVPTWQTDTIATVELKLSGTPIYETEEDVEEGISTCWNSLEVEYLMASLPRECIDSFVEEVTQLSAHFDLKLQFEQALTDPHSIRGAFNRIADRLERDFGGAGSEELAILIYREHAGW
ncbi:hypothetical protein [Duganella sp. Root336D2]|uniref:hypothetical protein n=1 Tax=Duganella sp. Root336D2 TaxID=1736518 RepID=UPI0006FDABA6|nr:hypothetical protein [Duganella sp. Root336D2]KQV49767.1 hypothetical protein ASD07_29775 [Duganella sp. Root336D2]